MCLEVGMEVELGLAGSDDVNMRVVSMQVSYYVR